jgi:hypothetical protein
MTTNILIDFMMIPLLLWRGNRRLMAAPTKPHSEFPGCGSDQGRPCKSDHLSGGWFKLIFAHFRRPARRQKKNRPEANLGPAEGTIAAYFALHLAHLAQSVLASTQHFIPQDGLAQAVALEQLDFLAQQVEQPVANNAEAQTSSARTLMVFIMVVCVWLMASTLAPFDRPAAEQ